MLWCVPTVNFFNWISASEDFAEIKEEREKKRKRTCSLWIFIRSIYNLKDHNEIILLYAVWDKFISNSVIADERIVIVADMSTTASSKKKSKITLDRLLLIKKNIMESLSLLSKHSKSPVPIERSNTVPKGKGKAIYRQIPNINERGGLVSKYSNITEEEPEHGKQKINMVCKPGEIVPQADTMQGTLLGIYQTWPQDDYSAQLFQDEFPTQTSSQTHVPTLQRHCTDYHRDREFVGQSRFTEDQQFGQQVSNFRSVKNQEIQTDFSDVSDVNEDIMTYLNQFKDKVAFNMHAPYRLRKSSGFFPYDEHDYSFYNNFHDRVELLPEGRLHRLPGEYISLTRRDQYSHGFRNRHQHDHISLAYQMSQKQQGLWKSNEQQIQRFQKLQLTPDTSSDLLPANYSNMLTPPRIDARVPSEDSGSILSSETDSDFMFYPCSSLTHTFKRMTLVDSKNTGFLSPPSDLPECINTNFSWRSEFCGSSLDEVTLQFYLDDDALSDDVFVDDLELAHSVTTSQNANKCFQHEAREEPVNKQIEIYNPSYQNTTGSAINEGDETGLTGSYSDNCYAYRYADIDEVLQSYKCSPSETELSVGDQNNGDKPISDADAGERTLSLSGGIDIQNSCDDPHLELNCELSNVFDSLRRNSTQTKARKMWRLRRAKCRKSPPNSFASDSTEEHHKFLCEPTMFTFDHICVVKHNPENSTSKPLRGILKNKDYTCHMRWENDLQSDHVGDNHSTVDGSRDNNPVLPFDADFDSNPASPCVYAVVKKQLSPSCTVSSADELAKDFTHSSLENISHDNSNFTSVSQEQSSAIASANKSDGSNNSPNAAPVHNEDEEIEQSSPKNTDDQFHIILIPNSRDGSREIVAVRKSSLEMYEWTRSLQRRHKRMARKANDGHKYTKSNDKYHLPQHQSEKAAAVSV